VQAVSALEGSGTVIVRLRRNGGWGGAVSVQFATSDGTATAGTDYAAASGTLNWADGDSSEKVFAIALTNEATVEPDETVIVTLSSLAGGATIDGSSTLTVTITNDDAAGPASGGGGGAISLELLWLVGAALAAIRRRNRAGAAAAATA
jgi:hypothetical protein